MSTPAILVAIVDDHAPSRRALARLLGSMECHARHFASGEAFLSADTTERFDCILLDFHFPGLGGLDLLHRVRACHPAACVIVITGRERVNTRRDCLVAGARAFMVKPVGRDDIAPFLPGLA